MNRPPYPSDLTDKEWAQIEPILYEDVYRKAGSKGKYPRREILNAILYVLRTGCQWTDIPHDFPPWKTVYSQFLRWRDKNLFQKLNTHLDECLKTLLGWNADLSLGLVDSQNVKTTEKKGSDVDLIEVKKLKVGNDIYWWVTLDS